MALDDSNNTVNPGAGTVDPNAATAPTKYLTVKNNGSVTVAQAPGSPAKAAVYWGQTNVPVSSFRFQSTNEAQYVEKFTVMATNSGEAVDAKANVTKVRLSYKNKAGTTLTAEQSFSNGASANFGFGCDSGCTAGTATDLRPYIPKDSSTDIAVNADIRTSSEGATQDRGGLSTDAPNLGASFSLDFSDTYNGDTGNGFKAVGEGSGAVINGATSGIGDVLGKNNMFIYRVYPKFDTIALSAPYTLVGTPDVLKFSITAMGLSDSKLFFDNQAATSGSIKFEVTASGNYIGNTAASSSFTVYDESGVVTDTITATGDVRPSPHGSLTMDFGNTGTGVDVEITGGQTKTFRVQFTNPGNKYTRPANTAAGVGADYFGLSLLDDEDGLIKWVGNSTGATSDQDSISHSGYLKNLPIYGPLFQR